MGFDAIYYTVQEPLWRKFLSHRNRVKLAIDNLHSKYYWRTSCDKLMHWCCTDDDLSSLRDRWPDEDEAVLLSLKLQFSYMDEDQDGLVAVKKM